MISSTTASDFQIYNTNVVLLAEVKSYGFSLRCLRDTIVIAPPSVGPVTVDASSMTGTSAGVSAAVGSDGGAPVSARGFCWNLTGNPTLSDNHITDAAIGTGTFAGTITGLTVGPKYYIRAYATNSAGTAYSEGTGFNAVLTTICPDTFNIQHTIGVRGVPATKAVTYHAVGTYLSGAARCWITQNLGADHQASSAIDATEASGGWYFQFNRSLGYKHDGTTHTPVAWTTSISEASDWTLINDPCNIMLGADWRIPTATEWTNAYGAPQNWANYTDAYNSVLKIHGAGFIDYNTGGLVSRGGDDDYWSSTGATSTAGMDFGISAGRIGVFNTNNKAYGFSVRCLRDALVKMPPSLGAVIVSSATMTDSTAQGTATILQDGGSPITERGLCWNTTGILPTITDRKIIYGALDMTYASLMTGLTAGVTYYVRAYAMNKIGLSYSPTVIQFKVCPPVFIVQHVAGMNGAPVDKTVTYHSVSSTLSGKAVCWITQNLGADQQATAVTDATEPSAGWYWQFNRIQGFKHDGTTRTPATSWIGINEASDWVASNDPCSLLLGSGWRIPTATEWTSAVTNGGWGGRNAYTSELKLHYGGQLSTGSLIDRGIYGIYWSSNQTGATSASYLEFSAATGISRVLSYSKSERGWSLRCLRDAVILSKPSVSKVMFSVSTSTAVDVSAAVTPDGGSPVTSRGFCWNTTGNPTVLDNVVPTGAGLGTFSNTITNLIEGPTYYVRAYAINGIDKAYSVEVSSFKVCPAAFSIQHIEGVNGAPVTKNVTYHSVTSLLSGNASCWLTQNLGADQQAIAVTDATEASAGWYWQFNRIQGYKHDGITRTPATSWISINEASDWAASNDPCSLLLGSGWRIPTATEWTSAVINGGWGSKNAYISELKLHYGGQLNSGSLIDRGIYGIYWSSNQTGTATASYLEFSAATGISRVLSYSKSERGWSLRCLR